MFGGMRVIISKNLRLQGLPFRSKNEYFGQYLLYRKVENHFFWYTLKGAEKLCGN
jgi:hypothetical protein